MGVMRCEEKAGTERMWGCSGKKTSLQTCFLENLERNEIYLIALTYISADCAQHPHQKIFLVFESAQTNDEQKLNCNDIHKELNAVNAEECRQATLGSARIVRGAVEGCRPFSG